MRWLTTRRRGDDEDVWLPPTARTALLAAVAAGATGDAAPLAGTGHHDAAPENLRQHLLVALVARSTGVLQRPHLMALHEAAAAADEASLAALGAEVAGWLTGARSRGEDADAAVRDVAAWLLRTSSQPTAVRAGVLLAAALPGLGGLAEEIAVLARSSAFPEAPAALGADLTAHQRLLLAAAAGQHGWGRVRAVHQLCRSTDPAVRRWLLETGFRNDVAWDLTAAEVAGGCDLSGHLADAAGRSTGVPGPAERPLLDGARDLLATLLAGVAYSRVEDVPTAGAAALTWVRLTARRPVHDLAVEDLHLLLALHGAASDERLRLSDEQAHELRTAAWSVLTAPEARETAQEALALPSGRASSLAAQVAGAYGLDVAGARLARVRADPADGRAWEDLARFPGGRRAEAVAAALALLPSDGIARDDRSLAPSGPVPTTPEQVRPHHGTTAVLAYLAPGSPDDGWDLVRLGLQAPLVGHRSSALSALATWPPAAWPADAAAALERAGARETAPDLRARIGRALEVARSAPDMWPPVTAGAPLLEVVGGGAVGDRPLPDDVAQPGGGLPWAPGALAGVLAQHTTPQPVDAALTANSVILAVEAYRRGWVGRDDLAAVQRAATAEPMNVLSAVDEVRTWSHALADREPEAQTLVQAGLAELAAWSLRTATTRGHARLGVALCTLLPDLGGHEQQIAILGRHVELAREAVHALSAGGRYEHLILDLALRHSGWGRIHAVEALLGTPDPRIRRWLVLDGFRNDVTAGYTAVGIARAADLAGQLEELEAELEREQRLDVHPEEADLLRGAREILEELLGRYGPAGDITHYPDAGRATTAWLRLVSRGAAPALLDLSAAARLLDEVDEEDRLDDDNGFSPEVLRAVSEAAGRLLSAPGLGATVLAGLAEHRIPAGPGAGIARRLGLDPTEALLQRLRGNPASWDWAEFATHAAHRPRELVAAALELLPEDGVGATPHDRLPMSVVHQGVMFVLQALRGRPTEAWPLVQRYLRSPEADVRLRAANQLADWPSGALPDHVRGAIEAALAVETDDLVRTRLQSATGD